jgi:hypothetical protein
VTIETVGAWSKTKPSPACVLNQYHSHNGGLTVTYFKTKDQAQRLADQLNYADAQGYTYRVQASRGGFYVAVFDQDYHHQGNI